MKEPKIVKIEDLSMYGDEAISKSESKWGNTIITYKNKTKKCFYKNTTHEIANYQEMVTMEQFASVLMENIDNLNNVIRGFNNDMNSLVTQFLDPMNGNILAILNILERKNIITKEELSEELKNISEEREKEMARLMNEKSIRDAITINELELNVKLDNNENKEEVEKALELIKSSDEYNKEFKGYSEYRNIGKEVNEKVVLKDGKKIIPIKDIETSLNPDVAKTYLTHLAKNSNLEEVIVGENYVF